MARCELRTCNENGLIQGANWAGRRTLQSAPNRPPDQLRFVSTVLHEARCPEIAPKAGQASRLHQRRHTPRSYPVLCGYELLIPSHGQMRTANLHRERPDPRRRLDASAYFAKCAESHGLACECAAAGRGRHSRAPCRLAEIFAARADLDRKEMQTLHDSLACFRVLGRINKDKLFQ